jgi:hypothetical protein
MKRNTKTGPLQEQDTPREAGLKSNKKDLSATTLPQEGIPATLAQEARSSAIQVQVVLATAIQAQGVDTTDTNLHKVDSITTNLLQGGTISLMKRAIMKFGREHS